MIPRTGHPTPDQPPDESLASDETRATARFEGALTTLDP